MLPINSQTMDLKDYETKYPHNMPAVRCAVSPAAELRDLTKEKVHIFTCKEKIQIGVLNRTDYEIKIDENRRVFVNGCFDCQFTEDSCDIIAYHFPRHKNCIIFDQKDVGQANYGSRYLMLLNDEGKLQRDPNYVINLPILNRLETKAEINLAKAYRDAYLHIWIWSKKELEGFIKDVWVNIRNMLGKVIVSSFAKSFNGTKNLLNLEAKSDHFSTSSLDLQKYIANNPDMLNVIKHISPLAAPNIAKQVSLFNIKGIELSITNYTSCKIAFSKKGLLKINGTAFGVLKQKKCALIAYCCNQYPNYVFFEEQTLDNLKNNPGFFVDMRLLKNLNKALNSSKVKYEPRSLLGYGKRHNLSMISHHFFVQILSEEKKIAAQEEGKGFLFLLEFFKKDSFLAKNLTKEVAVLMLKDFVHLAGCHILETDRQKCSKSIEQVMVG